MSELLALWGNLIKSSAVLDFGPIALSLVFAAAMTLRRPRSKRSRVFFPLLYEALVLTMAVIVFISALFPELYSVLTQRGSYIQVLSMIVVIYAVRDIYSTLYGQGVE